MTDPSDSPRTPPAPASSTGDDGEGLGGLFLLLPAFALLMKALLRRRLYLEHVVFFLHLRAAFFLLALVPLLLQRSWVTAGAVGTAVLYLLLATRRAYALGWAGTIARVAVLVPAYLVAAVVAFVGVVFVTVLTH